MKHFLFITIALAAGFVCAARAQERLVDSIAAVVNEAPITQVEVAKYTEQDEREFYRDLHDKPDAFKKRVVDLRLNTTDFLINRAIILNDSKESMKVPESILEEYVMDRIKESEKKYPDHGAFIKQLEAEGTTMEQLKARYRDQLMIEEMRLKNVPTPIISPHKIEVYYSEHHEEFKIDDEIKMRMIFLNRGPADSAELNRKRAEEILSQINGGASFEELARSYSEGSQKSEGGETGWEEISVVNQTLVESIKKLKTGEHTGVIDAPEGFYILLLEDRHPTHYKPLKEVRTQIERILTAKEIDRLQNEWIARLKKKTFVQRF